MKTMTILQGILKKKKKSPSEDGQFRETQNLYEKGIATIRDLIAPPAISLRPGSMQIGGIVARTYFVIAYPRFLSTNWFSPIINIDFAMDTALFVHPIPTTEILKNLRKSATQVQ